MYRPIHHGPRDARRGHVQGEEGSQHGLQPHADVRRVIHARVQQLDADGGPARVAAPGTVRQRSLHTVLKKTSVP